MNSNNQLSWSGIGLRFVFALLLVLLSYNPSGWSFFGWIFSAGQTPLVYKVVAGIVLLIGWAIYVRATYHSLGPIGIGLALALFACLIWLVAEWGWLDPKNINAMMWVLELVLAAILTVGMCWAHVRKRLSGQVSTDDIDN